MIYCSQCQATVKSLDLTKHLEAHHVGYSPEEEVQLFCGCCPFRASKQNMDLMVRHCHSSRHAPANVLIEWRDYQRMESKRVLEFLKIGVELMYGINSNLITGSTAGDPYGSEIPSPIPVSKREIEDVYWDSPQKFETSVRTPMRGRIQPTEIDANDSARNNRGDFSYEADKTWARIKRSSRRKRRAKLDEKLQRERVGYERRNIAEDLQNQFRATPRRSFRNPLSELKNNSRTQSISPESLDREEKVDVQKVLPSVIRPGEIQRAAFPDRKAPPDETQGKHRLRLDSRDRQCEEPDYHTEAVNQLAISKKNSQQKRKSMTLQQRYEVVLAKERGESPATTIMQLGVNRSNYYSIIRRSKEIKKLYSEGRGVSAKRIRTGELNRIEEPLKVFLQFCLDRRIPVSGHDLVVRAQELAKSIGADKVPDINWVNRWKKRYGVVGKNCHWEGNEYVLTTLPMREAVGGSSIGDARNKEDGQIPDPEEQEEEAHMDKDSGLLSISETPPAVQKTRLSTMES